MNPALASVLSATIRRILAALIGVACLALNQKLGLEIDAVGQAGIVAIVAGYVGQSLMNEKDKRAAAVEVHAAAITATPPPTVSEAEKSLAAAIEAGAKP